MSDPAPSAGLDEATHRDRPTQAQQFASKLLTVPQLLKLHPPEPLIADVLYRATLAVLFGAPGSYKTIVALDWGLCVATRLPWQAREVRGGPVLYVAAEGSAGDAELDAAAQAHEAQARQLRDPAIRAALRGAWQVIDPLRFAPGRSDPTAPLAELLALAPAELAGQVRAELAAAGLDPDAAGWPP
jgi:hypothetical protein